MSAPESQPTDLGLHPDAPWCCAGCGYPPDACGCTTQTTPESTIVQAISEHMTQDQRAKREHEAAARRVIGRLYAAGFQIIEAETESALPSLRIPLNAANLITD